MHFSERSNEKSKGKFEEITVSYHPEAVEELIDAAQFYESRDEGLGNKLLDCVDRTLNLIKHSPYIGPSDQLGRRKRLVKKFPYLLIYKFVDNRVFILAVAHCSRKPGYWKSREM